MRRCCLAVMFIGLLCEGGAALKPKERPPDYLERTLMV
jgi:hypothetical protein